MILLIDNYDSFTYNLVQRLGEIDPDVELEVVRNDETTPEEIVRLGPSHVIVSPGPCTPLEAGICNDVVRALAGKLPILGVCLGHQCIAYAFGARVVRAGRLMHGKTSMIHHDRCGVFAGLPSPFEATRYHSLTIEPASLPEDFLLTAWTEDDGVEREIMAIRHKRFALEGVQFHPESFLTDAGYRLLENFLRR